MGPLCPPGSGSGSGSETLQENSLFIRGFLIKSRHYWDTGVELDRCLFNSSQDKTDTYITGGFLPHLAVPRFLTQPVGGFINNILRGLLRINYELCTYNAALHNTFLKECFTYRSWTASAWRTRTIWRSTRWWPGLPQPRTQKLRSVVWSGSGPGSVEDPWHFGTNPDPQIRISD